MESNQNFSMARIGLLIKRDLAQKGWLIGIIMVILFVIWSINAFGFIHRNDASDFNLEQFPIMLYIGGFILASLSFLELSNPLKRQFYLQLPASTLEKYVSRWLLLGLGFTVAFICLFWLFSLFAIWIGSTFFEFEFKSFTPFSGQTWLLIKLFLGIQTIFFAGAATFKRFALFKTIFSVLLIGAIFAFIGLTSFRLIFNELFDGLYHFNPTMNLNGHEVMVEPSEKLITFLGNNFSFYAQLIGLGILAPLVLVLGYFKLKEQEI